MNLTTVVLISSDNQTRRALEQALPRHTLLITADTPYSGIPRIQQSLPSLVVCEGTPHMVMPVIQQARLLSPPCPVIVIGPQASVHEAMDSIRAGAADYLAKPPSREDLEAAIQRLAPARPSPPPTGHTGDRFALIVSVSPQMQLMKQLAREVALTDAAVLITGESGTGKELFAQAIHDASPRAHGPLVALNCAGIPEHLLESELFGYHQGAFTDAKQTKPGRFQLAEGGTLFLDEIGEMSPAAQAKLLRVLEDHTVDPLGDTESHKVNIRIIAATNEDLPTQIKAGRFRLDLYYRLNVYQLRIPPLRERPEDLEPILQHFLAQARRDHGCRIAGITPDALAVLRRHTWPGNVRELHNVVEWLTITCKADIIGVEHLPPSVKAGPDQETATAPLRPSLLAFGLSFQEMEKNMLEEALRQSGGNVSEASRLLKMTRNTLRYRMAKYHLS